jgi:hypothetical protein
MVRTHIALKLFRSATVMLSSSEFAAAAALRIADDSALGRSSGRTIREAAGSFPAPVLRTELAWVSG